MIKIYVDTGGSMPVLRDLISRGLAHCVGADIDANAYTIRRGEKVKSTLEAWDKDDQPWKEDTGSWADEKTPHQSSMTSDAWFKRTMTRDILTPHIGMGAKSSSPPTKTISGCIVSSCKSYSIFE